MRRTSIKNTLYTLALLGLDVAAYTAAFYLAVKARIWFGNFLESVPEFGGDAMRFGDLYFMPMLFLTIFFYEGLYQRRSPFIDELRDIGKSLAMLTILLFALISLGKLTHLVSRFTIIMMGPIAFAIIGLARYWGKIILHRLDIGTQNLLIIGDELNAEKTKRELLAEHTLGYKFAGFVSIKKVPKNLPELISTLNIQCVLIAAPDFNREKLYRLAGEVHRHVHHVLMIPEMRSGALLNSELYHLFVNQLFLIKMRNSLSEATSRFSKMAFDYTVILLTLPFWLPVICLLGLLVKLTSDGPAIFAQARIGQHGETIRVYKFRSMFADAEARLKILLARDKNARAEWKQSLKLKNDPRITRFGAFLRKTSLDELPQLFNVLKGEMSLVGPRPVPAKELKERYRDKSDHYKLVRPGMTGLWQISGRNDVTYEQRVNMDTWYVFNWSLYIDLVILYKTIGVVLKKRGAY